MDVGAGLRIGVVLGFGDQHIAAGEQRVSGCGEVLAHRGAGLRLEVFRPVLVLVLGVLRRAAVLGAIRRLRGFPVGHRRYLLIVAPDPLGIGEERQHVAVGEGLLRIHRVIAIARAGLLRLRLGETEVRVEPGLERVLIFGDGQLTTWS